MKLVYAFLLLLGSSQALQAANVKSTPVIKNSAAKPVALADKGKNAKTKGKGVAPIAGSRKIKSFCYMDEATGEVQGENIDERLPLASVSKVFTTLFAVLKNADSENAERRLPFNKKTIITKVYYSEVSSGVYNVHIKGARDPYFMRDSMHWLISKLNQAGVYKINKLTFDENFKYLHEAEKRFRVGKIRVDPVSGTEDLDFPSPGLIALELQQESIVSVDIGKKKQRVKIPEVLNFYEKTREKAAQKNITLVKNPIFKPASVQFIPSAIYVKPNNAQEVSISSPDLLHMVKMMNWFSNNQAANNMFQYSGGIPAFRELFYRRLNFTENDLLFKNGSGQNANVARTSHDYNEATCRTVVRVLHGLKKNLDVQGLKLENALAVVGADHLSTVSGKTYANTVTNLSVIAKSGTVAKSVGLAGMISAQKGNFFFYYNIEPRVAKSDRSRENEAKICRSVISKNLNNLVVKLGGGKPIAYTPAYYDPERVDNEDRVNDENSRESGTLAGEVAVNPPPSPIME